MERIGSAAEFLSERNQFVATAPSNDGLDCSTCATRITNFPPVAQPPSAVSRRQAKEGGCATEPRPQIATKRVKPYEQSRSHTAFCEPLQVRTAPGEESSEVGCQQNPFGKPAKRPEWGREREHVGHQRPATLGWIEQVVMLEESESAAGHAILKETARLECGNPNRESLCYTKMPALPRDLVAKLKQSRRWTRDHTFPG
jgi:hypothetical protein